MNREIEGDLIFYCQEHEITIMAYSPLAQDISKIPFLDRDGVMRSMARDAATPRPRSLSTGSSPMTT